MMRGVKFLFDEREKNPRDNRFLTRSRALRRQHLSRRAARAGLVSGGVFAVAKKPAVPSSAKGHTQWTARDPPNA